ncbi:MAG: double-strand break repair helicase AddA [Pseudomonadota bacterium]
MTLNDATRAQIDAARPDASTWLSANAGSGKTRVLTDRVARLLLDGVDPQQILCLTYTKAAASEMQNRLFQRLGAWAMLRDEELQQAMEVLGVANPLGADNLRRARTLFARAIETPGGLKIQTIHSFCAALLRRFPLEAGVNPEFKEIEDRAADLLRAEIVDDMAVSDADSVAGITKYYAGEDFNKLTGSIVNMRSQFTAARTLSDILKAFDQPSDLSTESIEQRAFIGGEKALISRILPALQAKGGTDGKAAKTLEDLAEINVNSLPVLEKVFLTGSSAKKPFTAKLGSFPTKATRAIIASQMPMLNALMERVEQTREARLALAAAERSHALHTFAKTFLLRYDTAKQRRGWLDFDDLILKARDLLSNDAVSAWVLYRIDGGIDHILVDEAQDTSRPQWDVIERLTDEFHSGVGSKDAVDRTLFVVGDKKQSIYSFQGADPRQFDAKSAAFARKISAAHKPFQHRSLEYSFRSSSAILRIVDTVFDPRRQPDFGKETQHKAFKEMLPGRVDLWPPVEKAEDEPDTHWTDPVDRRSARHHTVVLAEKIATQIADLINGNHYIPEDTKEPDQFVRRRIKPGDFLILVQRRSALFSEIIRACKAANLPIAGADRLKVGAELAVKDLGSLLSFLATPDDSLSLAIALKSPLFGWTEQELFDLAYRRTEDSLWQALRKCQDTHGATLAVLQDLRAQVDFLRPYDLIERILTRHSGRMKLLGRLGPEAEDGINAMLVQALAYERNDVPSLTGFIEWMQTDEVEIKRQIDAASNQIRVMTVHGAKGLEAPIVILPDTQAPRTEVRADILDQNGVPTWKTVADEMPQAMRATVEKLKDEQTEERLRLLYVAMTRAEKWLIVTMAGSPSKDGSDWYQMIAEAMAHANAVTPPGMDFLRYEEGDWDAHPLDLHGDIDDKSTVLEPLFLQQPAAPPSPIDVISPSDLGGAKALPGDEGEDTEAAMHYGIMVHELLEKLSGIDPPARAAIAPNMVSGDLGERAIAEALSVFNTQALTHLFGENSFAEVPISASIKKRPAHGIIDRLAIFDDRVLAVDFKTNRTLPQLADECPEGILRQMGAYTQMLEQLYPDHQVETAILWTAGPSLMTLPRELVMAALDRACALDAVLTHS